jgi:FkbM family methyltransferase
MRSIATDRLACFGTYMVCFGVIRGAGLFLLSSLSRKSRGRKVELLLPDSGGTLTLRLGTSDLFVFGDIFLRHEYGWDLSPSPRVIVDAGAYTGLSTCYFANRFPDATIIAIEPDEENYELLKLNTARYENVHTTRAALWSESGFVSLMDPGYGAWGLQLLESANTNTVKAVNSAAARSEPVRALTVADIIREYHLDKIDLLKVDVEGSEKEIFAHAGPWIDSVDAICIELHDRFKAGCSRSFFRAVDDFPVELRRGEDVLVMRDRSRVSPELESARA